MSWLAVFDLDKTLLSKDEVIKDYSIRVIKAFKERGHKVAIATGRSILRSEEYAELIDADGLVTLNGSSTFIKGKLIHQIPIDEEKVRDLIQKLKAIPELYIMLEYPTKVINSNPKWVVPGVRGYSDLSDFDVHEIQNIKLDCLNIEALEAIDFDDYGVRLISSRHDPSFHILTNKTVDKKWGVLKLMETFGIDCEHVIAFGDDYNDLKMLEMAKIGVVVNNGGDDIKEIADYIVPSNDEEGPAHLLNELFDLKVED